MTRKLTEEDRRKLRKAAEARLAQAPAPARSHPSTSALLHELQVHQIELEMQNDELQRDQAELEESHQRFVDLYDFAPVGYLTVSPSGVIQEANLTAASMLGVERRILPGRPFASFVERGDADRWHLLLRSVLRGSEHQECDLAIRLGDDSVFDAHLACRRRGSPGSDASVRVSLSDVTARNRAQAALAESEARFRAYVRRAPVGIFVVDGRGRFVDGNPAGLELLGVDEASAASKAVQDFLDEAGREEAPRALSALSATGKLEKEVRLRRPDGQDRRIILSVAAIAEDRFLAFCQDITERELAEEQLREVKERLSFVIDGSNDGFWDWDVPSGRAKFSRRWASMFGYDLDELEPTVETWERMAHHEDHAAAGSTIQAHLQGRTDHFETVERVRHKGGHWVWVLARGKVVERDAAGSPVRVTGTFTDISERRRAEEALQTTLAEKDVVLGELRKALQEVKTLSGLLPICMYCKKIRDDKGYWKRIEEYIQSRTDAVFSHGMCEDCYRKHQAD